MAVQYFLSWVILSSAELLFCRNFKFPKLPKASRKARTEGRGKRSFFSRQAAPFFSRKLSHGGGYEWHFTLIAAVYQQKLLQKKTLLKHRIFKWTDLSITPKYQDIILTNRWILKKKKRFYSKSWKIRQFSRILDLSPFMVFPWSILTISYAF